MKLGVEVLVSDPDKLEDIRQRETDITKESVQKILGAGANVVLCSGGIDDLCLKVDYGVLIFHILFTNKIKNFQFFS